MPKLVFSILGLCTFSVWTASGQTNTVAPGVSTAVPSSTNATPLAPPSDTVPPGSAAVVAPTAPPVTAAPTPAPVKIAPDVAPAAAPPRVVAAAPRPIKPRRARLYHLTPISWIVATRNNLDKDDRYVTIVGHVTRRIGDDEYWFADDTGSVRLDSENFDLPIGTKLIIGGRIDQAWLGFGHLEVDVSRWRYAGR